MAYGEQISRFDRARALVAVGAIHAALGYALISGLGADVVRTVSDGLDVITVSPDPITEPQAVPEDRRAQDEEGAASPKNLEAQATQIVAPEPEIPLEPVSPVIAAPITGDGNEADAGASDRPGPGFGSGGAGDGTGSGRDGSGSGAGITSAPVHISGAITRRDIPREVWREKGRGKVFVQFTVEANGRTSGCRIRQSSGFPALDAITCDLIEERFRFEPARDTHGRAVAQPYGWVQDWWLGRPRR